MADNKIAVHVKNEEQWNEVRDYYTDNRISYEEIRFNHPDDELVIDSGSLWDTLEFYKSSCSEYELIEFNEWKERVKGDIVQPIRTYEFNNIDTDLEPTKLPVVVEHGNYVFGKWIAREVNEDRLGVIDYYFPSEVVVIGNIHE